MADPVGETPDSRPGRADPDPSPGLAQRPKYSPLVRRLAEEFGVDLATVTGTGPNGRITRHDVQQAASDDQPPAGEPPSAPPSNDPPSNDRDSPAPGNDAGIDDVHPVDADASLAESEPPSEGPKPQPIATRATFVVSSTVDGSQLARAQDRVGSHTGRAIGLDALLLKLVGAAIVDVPELQLDSDPGAVGFIRVTENGMVTDVVPQVANTDVTAIDLAIADRVRSFQAGDEPIVAPVLVLDAGALGVSTVTAALEPGAVAVLTFGRFERRPRGRGSRLTITATFAQDEIELGRAVDFLKRLELFVEDPILAFAR